TRSVHAAALAEGDGTILFAREDVGRHNAVDKLVGAALRGGVAREGRFMVVTSRCSYEIIEKAAAADVRTVVAVSAPTSYALERARARRINLYAVARGDGAMAFVGPAASPSGEAAA
ncbi:MAG: formate dehydrogenase accessory sulfurtransferase FdhD, partial [Hyphomicrobiales bacterium]|nr:formate dehydrogenase accessory sulfurtransferase FdhD [Hyphomicrobiales bacterium]